MSHRNVLLSNILSTVSHIWSWKGYMITAVATVAFANVVLVIFGSTIPNVLLMVFGNTVPGVFQSFLKVAISSVILGAVFVFAMAWLLRAKPRYRPRSYRIVIFDVYGQVTTIDGLRTSFRNHDVAWSYMKQHKERYPLHNFALVSDAKDDKPTIYRYI